MKHSFLRNSNDAAFLLTVVVFFLFIGLCLPFFIVLFIMKMAQLSGVEWWMVFAPIYLPIFVLAFIWWFCLMVLFYNVVFLRSESKR